MDARKVFKAHGAPTPDAGERWRRDCHESVLRELESRVDEFFDTDLHQDARAAAADLERAGSRTIRGDLDHNDEDLAAADVGPTGGAGSARRHRPAQNGAPQEEGERRSSLIRARSYLGKRVSRRLARLKEVARQPKERSRLPGIDSHVAPIGDRRGSSIQRPYAMSDDLRVPERRESVLQAAAAGEDADEEAQLWEFVAMLQDEDPANHLVGARGLRGLLSRTFAPPIALVVQSGVLPRLVELLERDQPPEELVYEILWALSNVASSTSEMTEAVVQALAIPAVVHILLSEPSERVHEQAIWCISNICGDSLAHRDLVYHSFPMQSFLTSLVTAPSPSGVRVSVWFLANFLRFKPYPFIPSEFEPVLRALGTLATSNDTDVFTDACWALNSVMAASEESDDTVIWADAVLLFSDAIPQLVARFGHLDHTHELEASLGVICKAARSSHMSTRLRRAILEDLPPVLRHVREAFRRCACLTVLNIAEHDAALVRASDVLGACFELLEDESNGVDQVAIEVLSVVVANANRRELIDLAERGALEGLAAYLQKVATMLVLERDDGSDANNADVADVEDQGLLPLRVLQTILAHDGAKVRVLGVNSFREACASVGIPASVKTLAEDVHMPGEDSSPVAVLAQKVLATMNSTRGRA